MRGREKKPRASIQSNPKKASKHYGHTCVALNFIFTPYGIFQDANSSEREKRRKKHPSFKKIRRTVVLVPML
jgi:hypothetical protein